MLTKKILMIEDDTALVELVRIHLSELPGRLTAFNSGPEGLAWLEQHPADLCILDVMLPGMNGLEICRHIRQRQVATPVLMLTARSEERDKVTGLEAGADDYLTKPFGIQEFMARIRALLRRADWGRPETASPPAESGVNTHRELTIDRGKRSVTVRGQRVELTPKEFELLALLARHPGKSYSRKDLLAQVWGYTFEGYEHTVTAHVNRLRSKIEPNFQDPVYILTTWGIGYRFAEADPPNLP